MKKLILPLFATFLTFSAQAAETCIIDTVGGIRGKLNEDKFQFVFVSTTSCAGKKVETKKVIGDKIFNHETIIGAYNTFEIEQRNAIFTQMESGDFVLRFSQQLAKQPGDDDPFIQAKRYQL